MYPLIENHVVVDNYFTHKHSKVKRWFAAYPRYQIHYTSTYAAWLNQVEIWFNIITQRVIRRGTFRSVRELIAKIEQFVIHYSLGSHPFAWTATVDSMLQGNIPIHTGDHHLKRDFKLNLKIGSKLNDFSKRTNNKVEKGIFLTS